MGKTNFGILLKGMEETHEKHRKWNHRQIQAPSRKKFRQVNQNFHEQWTKFSDWLEFHMTPEALISSKIIDNKFKKYTFKTSETPRQCVEKESTSFFMKN